MPSRKSATSATPHASNFLSALRDTARNLKEKYKGKPIELALHFGIKLPRKPVLVMIELGVITEEEAIKRFGTIEPGIRELVEDVCTLRVRNAVAVANRGGGKSKGVSFIEFYLWMILDFDALNLGGSELQAAGVNFSGQRPGFIAQLLGSWVFPLLLMILFWVWISRSTAVRRSRKACISSSCRRLCSAPMASSCMV